MKINRHYNGVYSMGAPRLGVYQTRFDLGRWPHQLVRTITGAVALAATAAIWATLFGLL